jgi:hypothetical protein
MTTNQFVQQGIGAIKSGGRIGSITINEYAGSPESAVVGNRIGDLTIDYTNGAIYVFTGTSGAKTVWKLVTKAA